VLLAASLAWLGAAFLVWRTGVPGSLELPHLDVGDYFTSEELRASERYERFLRWNFLLSQVVLVGVLAVYAARGERLTRESAAGRIGTGMLLGMLGLGILWLAQIPFGLAAHWWDRRHDIASEGYLEWLLDGWLVLAGQFAFVCLALLIVMALAGAFPRHWWIPAVPAFVALATLFAFLYPYLLPDVRPLRDPALEASARAYAREQGMDPVAVRVEDVGGSTTAPNAEAAGLGPSRRVVLWSTLLDGRFADDEVRVVLAHELGHLSRDHLWKSIAWYALLAVPGAYLIAVATRRRGGMADPRAVPLALLVLVGLQLLALPVDSAFSRRLEAEADWIALRTTRDPQAAEELFAGFSTTALVQPSPPTWWHLLVDTHPTMIERIAMAQAWQARSRERPPAPAP
jgi:STE24 endopeptidase